MTRGGLRERLVIRPLEERDLEEKTRLALRTWHETYDEGLIPRAWSNEHLSYDQLLAFQQRRGLDSWLVAETDGELVGFASYDAEARPSADRPGMSELSSIYVLRAWQGRGVGRALMEEALARCPHDQVVVYVVEGNERAIGFYERMGFVPTGRRRPDDAWVDLEMVRDARRD